MKSSLLLFSYIDPVSGMILLQLILVGVFSFLARFRQKIWRFASQLFLKKRGESFAEATAMGILPLTRPSSGEMEPEAEIRSLDGYLVRGDSQSQLKRRAA